LRQFTKRKVDIYHQRTLFSTNSKSAKAIKMNQESPDSIATQPIAISLTRLMAAYFLAAVVFALIDFIWLTQIGPNLYRPTLDEVLYDGVRWGPAISFYLIYLIGIVWFGIRPGLLTRNSKTAFCQGALFGAIAYATYDLTNHATLKVWSTLITISDISWGAFLTGTTAAITTAILMKFDRADSIKN